MQHSTQPNRRKYRLYWIYDNRVAHQCPLKDGYIGVTTKTIGQRLLSHKRSKYNNVEKPNTCIRPMYQHLSSIPDEHIAIKEIIWSYNEESIAAVERAFRPTGNIGWNVHAGGKLQGKSQPVIVEFTDGTRKRYETMSGVTADGVNQGNLSQYLRGKVKSVKNVKSAYYVL